MKIFELDQKLSIEPEFGVVFMELVKKNRPEWVVEIGTGQGYSTMWILKGLNANNRGVVYTFDNVDRQPYAWDAEGIDDHRVRLFSDFHALDCPESVDMIFHDAGHWFEHVEADLKPLIPRVTVGGVVCVHDIVHSNDMGEKLKAWFESMPAWSYREMRDGCGLGIAERVR
jgi:predicted O-methyltransferase YrrM